MVVPNRLGVRRVECASKCRAHGHDPEKVAGGDERAIDLFRRGASWRLAMAEVVWFVAAHAAERGRAAAPIRVIRWRDRTAALRARRMDADDVVRVGVWEWPDERGVDDGEDRRCRPDSQRQRRDRDEREPRCPSQSPQRAPYVDHGRQEWRVRGLMIDGMGRMEKGFAEGKKAGRRALKRPRE